MAILSTDGKLKREIRLRGKQTTNLAFGGPDGRTVFVTQRQGGFIEAFRVERPGREYCLQLSVDHVPPFCAACGAAVTLAMSTGHSARQVFDLPEPTPLVVTDHRAHDCRCAACGTHSRAGFPLGVNAPVQYGPRIDAVVTYLLPYQLLPEDRLPAALFAVRAYAQLEVLADQHASSAYCPGKTV